MLFNYLSKYEVVPWDDLRYIFGEIMYGGHITDVILFLKHFSFYFINYLFKTFFFLLNNFIIIFKKIFFFYVYFLQY